MLNHKKRCPVAYLEPRIFKHTRYNNIMQAIFPWKHPENIQSRSKHLNIPLDKLISIIQDCPIHTGFDPFPVIVC